MDKRISGNWVVGLAVTLATLGAMTTTVVAKSINVTVTGARSDAGIVRCGLFASADGFREPGREIRESTGKINSGRTICSFKTVPEGTYALAVFHAERGERRMDIGLFGKPKQGVGFSRNPSITFGPPDFRAAAFVVGSEPVDLHVKLNY